MIILWTPGAGMPPIDGGGSAQDIAEIPRGAGAGVAERVR